MEKKPLTSKDFIVGNVIVTRRGCFVVLNQSQSGIYILDHRGNPEWISYLTMMNHDYTFTDGTLAYHLI